MVLAAATVLEGINVELALIQKEEMALRIEFTTANNIFDCVFQRIAPKSTFPDLFFHFPISAFTATDMSCTVGDYLFWRLSALGVRYVISHNRSTSCSNLRLRPCLTCF